MQDMMLNQRYQDKLDGTVKLHIIQDMMLNQNQRYQDKLDRTVKLHIIQDGMLNQRYYG